MAPAEATRQRVGSASDVATFFSSPRGAKHGGIGAVNRQQIRTNRQDKPIPATRFKPETAGLGPGIHPASSPPPEKSTHHIQL